MLKKIIFGIVIGLLVSMTATGLIYAGNKVAVNKGNNNQELNKEKTTDTDDGLQDEVNEDPNVFHITSSSNHGGSIGAIDKDGTILSKRNISVEKGGSITFTITVDSGYKLEWLRVDNDKFTEITDYDADGDDTIEYTFTAVEKNHTMHAHFKKIKQPKQ